MWQSWCERRKTIRLIMIATDNKIFWTELNYPYLPLSCFGRSTGVERDPRSALAGKLFLTLHCQHQNNLAFRWAAEKAILTTRQLWGTKSQDSVHKPQLLKRKESRSGIEPRTFCLYQRQGLTATPNLARIIISSSLMLGLAHWK